MTLQDYIDEVKLRSLRHDIHVKSNDLLIATYINRGRHQAQRAALSYGYNKFGSIAAISGALGVPDTLISSVDSMNRPINAIRYPMPSDLIDITNLAIFYNDTATGTKWKKEARKVDEREAFGVHYNTWNMPSIERPVYYVESIIENAVGNVGNYLILAGLNDDSALITLSDIMLQLWYIKAIPYLSVVTDTENWLSPDLQELAVYHAMLNVVRDNGSMQTYQSFQQDINKKIQTISQNYQINAIEEVRELATNEAV